MCDTVQEGFRLLLISAPISLSHTVVSSLLPSNWYSFLWLIHQQYGTPNDNNLNDIKPNDIKPNNINPNAILSRMT